jgi:predicted secreted protein
MLVKTLIVVSLIVNFVWTTTDQGFRKINIKELEGEASYLPIKGGEKFIIEIEGNPTTGYNWYLDKKEELDQNSLITPLYLKENNLGEFYKNPSEQKQQNEEMRLGAGGLFHFKFQASQKNSGSEVLNFVYKRSWESEGQITKSINVKVVQQNNSDL